LSATLAASGTAAAQADFYKGKTIELIISTGVGGGLDTNARMVVRHLPKHIPGNPTIIAKNMPGAGHVRAANYIYNQAPKDGTTIGTLIPAFILAQVLNRTDAIQFDAAKMQWLASTSASNSTVYVWKTTGVNSIEDAKKKTVLMGGTGAGLLHHALSADPESYIRDAIQDRLRVQQHRRDRPRHGARRSAGPRRQ
jgi:tripartite-type tricarboxylate transporter receptor subunit TctC